MTQARDITKKSLKLPATDRLYEVEGRYIKVRVVKREPPPGAPDFGVAYLQVSGSETDADGWALGHGGGHRVSPAEVHTVMYDSSVDFPALVENLRVECIAKTLRASELQDQIDAI